MGKYLIIPNADFSSVAVSHIVIGDKVLVNVIASPASGGTVSGGGNYDVGSSVQISATPNTGYLFSKWSDGNTNATRIIVANENATYTAEFILEWTNGFYKSEDGGIVDAEHHGTTVQDGMVPKFCYTKQFTISSGKTSVALTCNSSWFVAIRIWDSNNQYVGEGSVKWSEGGYSQPNLPAGGKIAFNIRLNEVAQEITPQDVVSDADVEINFS